MIRLYRVEVQGNSDPVALLSDFRDNFGPQTGRLICAPQSLKDLLAPIPNASRAMIALAFSPRNLDWFARGTECGDGAVALCYGEPPAASNQICWRARYTPPNDKHWRVESSRQPRTPDAIGAQLRPVVRLSHTVAVVDRYFRAAGDQGIGCCSTLLRSLEEWPNAEQRSVEVHLSLHDGAAPVDPLAKYEKLKRLADETVMALDEGWRAQRLLGPTDPSIAIAAYVYDHPSRLPHDRYLIAGDFVISLSTGFGPAADPDEDCLLQREPPSKGTTVRRKLRDSQEARNADGSVACVCSTNARTAAAPDSL